MFRGSAVTSLQLLRSLSHQRSRRPRVVTVRAVMAAMVVRAVMDVVAAIRVMAIARVVVMVSATVSVVNQRPALRIRIKTRQPANNHKPRKRTDVTSRAHRVSHASRVRRVMPLLRTQHPPWQLQVRKVSVRHERKARVVVVVAAAAVVVVVGAIVQTGPRQRIRRSLQRLFR